MTRIGKELGSRSAELSQKCLSQPGETPRGLLRNMKSVTQYSFIYSHYNPHRIEKNGWLGL